MLEWILKKFSSSPFHPRLDSATFSDLLASSIFVLTTIFPSTSTSFVYICLVFDVSARVSRAHVIIYHIVALYIFDFVSFLEELFLQTRAFKQPATLCFF